MLRIMQVMAALFTISYSDGNISKVFYSASSPGAEPGENIIVLSQDPDVSGLLF